MPVKIDIRIVLLWVSSGVVFLAFLSSPSSLESQTTDSRENSATAYRLPLPVNEVVLTFHALDLHGLPVNDLKPGDVQVFDNEEPARRIVEFNSLQNRPIRAGILIDTSESMQQVLSTDKVLAGRFVQRFFRQKSDQAFVMDFGYSSEFAQSLTNNAAALLSHTEFPKGRSEKLIPLVRKTFGDEMIISADSNGSYTVAEAIPIGKLMQEYKYAFYEEPVPFDWYEETKAVADALEIPIAGGEQEPSTHNFRWLVANGGLSIVQPDMFYFGGMIRCTQIARMAHAFGKQCIPHISSTGLGYVYMMHFVSSIPNSGPYHEFKEFNSELPYHCATSSPEIAPTSW